MLGTPSVVLGPALLSKCEISLFCELFGSHRGMAHRFAVSPSRTLVRACCETSFGLDTGSVFRFRTAVASDRLLPPSTYPLANPRSRFSSRVPACAVHEMRSLTFHDVQTRFGRIDASRRGLSPRDTTSLHVSRKRNTFRSWPLAPLSPLRASRAVLSDDLRASRRGLGCVLPPPREGCRRRNSPRCLPSVVHARAIEHVIDPGAHHPESSGEPHQLEWVGPMRESPGHSKRSAQRLATPSEIATSRSSSRPRTERRPLRGCPAVGRRCASLSRDFDYRSLQHDSDTRACLRAVDPLPCEAACPCPRLLCSASCDTDGPKSHAVCRSSPHRPSRATCRTFRCREQGLWSGLLGKEGSSTHYCAKQHGPVIPE